MNSKAKGKRGELEFAALCRSYGYEDARRGQQYCGANGDADVVGLDGIYAEVKRVEQLNIYDAMSKAISDKGADQTPIVAHRKNGKGWLITMIAADWFRLYGESNQT